MTTVFEIDGEASRPSKVLRNGVSLPVDEKLRWRDIAGMPFPAIYLNDVRQYDVELWIAGSLLHRIPPQSALTDEIYGRYEGAPERPSPSLPHGTDPDWSQRLAALREEIATHPGTDIEQTWGGLYRMLQVHLLNAAELDQLLEKVATDQELAVEMFQNTAPPVVRKQVETRVDQRLHNYVASSSSLIDHTRRVFNRYEGSKLRTEYEVAR